MRVYLGKELYAQLTVSDFFDELPDAHEGGVSKEHRRLCQQNLNTAISRLPLHISPSLEMVMALTLAVGSR